jgi:hypothetical protein
MEIGSQVLHLGIRNLISYHVSSRMQDRSVRALTPAPMLLDVIKG